MTSSLGKEVILKGWERAGITDRIKMGSAKLPTPDPFHELNPLDRNEEQYDIGEAIINNKDQLADGLTHCTENSDDSDSEFAKFNTREKSVLIRAKINTFKVIQEKISV